MIKFLHWNMQLVHLILHEISQKIIIIIISLFYSPILDHWVYSTLYLIVSMIVPFISLDHPWVFFMVFFLPKKSQQAMGIGA